jgi:hypothetical protein
MLLFDSIGLLEGSSAHMGRTKEVLSNFYTTTLGRTVMNMEIIIIEHGSKIFIFVEQTALNIQFCQN